MMPIILSSIGLILGMYGCYLTIRKQIFDIWHKRVGVYYLQINQPLFRLRDKMTLKIGEVIFRRYLSKPDPLMADVREGNEVIIGFILIMFGFLSQLTAYIIVLCKRQ